MKRQGLPIRFNMLHTSKKESVLRSPRLGAGIVFVVCALLLSANFPPPAAWGQSVWPLMPYEVRIEVAVDPQLPGGRELERNLCLALATRIETVIGAAWNAVVEPAAAPLHGALYRGLKELQPAQLSSTPEKLDKLLLLAVERTPEGMSVVARDYDVRTRTLSAAVAHPVWQVGELLHASLDALLSAFAPLGRVERIEKDEVVLRLKASGLPLSDRRLALVREGDVFRPIIRRNDQEGNFRAATPAPWSFFMVSKISPEETRCRLHTGMRSALVTRGRGRVESLALRVVPPEGATVLRLISRTEPKQPLAGYEVYARVPGGKTAILLGRTDEQGCFTVNSDGHLLRVLLVKNGTEPLARLPVVPGLERELTAEIINDDLRLRAEGFITGLQEELVDLVARRAILLFRLRARLEEGKIEEARKLLDELQRLPDAPRFYARINREQERLMTTDHIVQRKIELLLNDTRQLIDKHLSPSEIAVAEREVREALAAAREAAKQKPTEEKPPEAKPAEEKSAETKPPEPPPS